MVEQALQGDTDKLNEFVLGLEVFNRGDSFDPRIDSIVRVEARRLRERLRKYYEQEGRDDPIVITLRPRSFVPEFNQASPGRPPAPSRLRAWGDAHRTIAIAMAALLCGVGVTAVFLPRLWQRPVPPQTVSIAVRPFQMISTAPDQDILGRSISDYILTGLANTPGLRLLSGGSQEQSGNPDYVVEGSVQVKDGRLRVSVKMTDTRAQSYILAETREAELTGLPDLQRGITNAIASRVRIPLPPGGGDIVMRRRPASPEAYGAFLKGQYYWYQSEAGSVEKSIALFEEATRRDPNYAPAWAWLSQSYQLVIMQTDGQDGAIIAKGRQAARKALALDDQLAEAHASVGSYAALDWDWNTAQQSFRRAIQLNPLWAHGHLTYALMYLLPTRRLPEALHAVLRAHELDPHTRMTRVMLSEVLYFNRDYPRAIAESEDLFKAAPAAAPGNRVYFLSLSLSGQGSRALRELTATAAAADDRSPGTGVLGYLLARQGDRRQARAIQQRLLHSPEASPLTVALVSVGLGDHDEAFRQLRSAVSKHVPAVPQVAADPVFEPLHADPRFAELLQSLGLAPLN